jgi:D-glycero-D-manno-heptose 1,7-bisphosphate phosphatase
MSSRLNASDFARVKFVFLDRDGVINRKPPESQYVTSCDEFEVLPGVERAIALLNQTFRKVIVVTNQRGIALNRYSEGDLLSIHNMLRVRLASFGAHIDSIYHCPHDVGECSCRKPKTGLFERAFQDFPEATPENSVMIGDSDSDILAGASLGMKTILITEKGEPHEGRTVPPSAFGRSLLDVVETYLC